jgi:alcohol dehydrogenase class IV
MIKKLLGKLGTDFLLSVSAVVLFNGVIQFVLNPYLSEQMGAEKFGTVIYLLAIISVMGAFGTAAHPRLAELAEVCGLEGSTAEEKATAFLNWIEDTNRALGLPDSFPGIRDEDIPQMIRWARKEAHPLYPVPVIWTEADFHKLITSLRK